MATITEDYVSSETAKLLKEKGFPQQSMEFVVTTRDCSFIINRSQKVKERAGTRFPYYPYSKLFLYEEDWAVLPTLYMAIKWLRETKDWYIVLTPMFANDINHKMVLYGYDWEISSPSREQTEHSKDFLPNYEKACEDALKYCLKNLI